MVFSLCKAEKISILANCLEHHLQTRTLQDAARSCKQGQQGMKWPPILQVERMCLPMKCAPLNSPFGIFMR